MLVLSLLVAIAGLIMILRPDLIWLIAESWKSGDGTEPSGLYLISTRFGGAACLLAGIGGIVAAIS
jgi:hypothetical protein